MIAKALFRERGDYREPAACNISPRPAARELNNSGFVFIPSRAVSFSAEFFTLT